MKQIVLVFIGGGLGSVCRYTVGRTFNNTPIHFPFGTLGVNTIGCFLIGLILGYFIKDGEISNSYTVLLATGFCGGFTTFSAFAFENQMFLKNGDFTNFILYSLGSVAFGILAVFFGIFLSKFI